MPPPPPCMEECIQYVQKHATNPWELIAFSGGGDWCNSSDEPPGFTPTAAAIDSIQLMDQILSSKS